MSEFLFALAIAAGYLLGSVPTGYLLARLRGVEIQQVGSGNIGATNVLRSLGLFPGILVAIADPAKGATAVLLAMLLNIGPWGVALAGLAAVLGNNFNIFLRFKGGKGVATSVGVFLPIEPFVTLAATAIAMVTIALGRYVSLGSLVGMISAPLLLLMRDFHPSSLFLAVGLALLACARHWTNVVSLARGTERRLGEGRDRSL